MVQQKTHHHPPPFVIHVDVEGRGIRVVRVVLIELAERVRLVTFVVVYHRAMPIFIGSS